MQTDVNEDIVKVIEYGDVKITLVGTAHVSQKSVELIEEKIQSGQYDCIAVELCLARHENIINRDWWRDLDIYHIFRHGKAMLLLLNMVLSAYQRRLAAKIGVEAGMEMQRAIQLAREKGIRLEAIDRSITTTLQRLIHKVGFWRKLKLFYGMLAGFVIGEEINEEQIEDLKKGDMLHMVIEEFGQSLPEIKQVLIDERDHYMVGRLTQLAVSPNAPKNIIAFVGAGHLMGMVPMFASPPDLQRLDELDQKPPPSWAGYYITFAISLFMLIAFYIGFKRSTELGWHLLMTWVLAHGVLSALGAALAFAHPVSILMAFVASPVTSLCPAIGTGMVIGLLESYLRKPRVDDFERLRDDLIHWKMWWKNKAIRVFLVFFFAKIGSAVGTYVAGASIIHHLLK